MSWVEFNAGTARVLVQTADVLAVLERPGSGLCDVYTTSFTDGITVDHTYAELEAILLGDDDEDDTPVLTALEASNESE